ncbi:MAG: hypothetical protein WBD07_18230 [Vicinamibacterales bacterium]
MNPRTEKAVVREVPPGQVPPQFKGLLPASRRLYWIEAPIGDAWVAAYRIVVLDGRPIIAELRVFPAEPRIGDREFGPGEWSGSFNATASVPGQGITAGLVKKKIQVSIPIDHITEIRAKMQALAEQHWGITRSSRGRKPKPALFYAEVARDYVNALTAGSRQPAADLAKARGISRALSRALVSRARAMRFLEIAAAGRAGGALTDAARRVLQGAARASSKSKRRTRR